MEYFTLILFVYNILFDLPDMGTPNKDRLQVMQSSLYLKYDLALYPRSDKRHIIIFNFLSYFCRNWPKMDQF